MAITTAVVPVAGLATRLRPLSRGVPKALLPVAGRPVIQHIVDELAACGFRRVVLVTGRGRAGFAAHFAEAEGPEIVCVEQPRPLGLGDALLRAAPEVDGAFAIALGDALLGHGAPVRAVDRLAEAVRQGASVAIAVEEVAPADTVRYGIVAPAGEGESRGAAGEGDPFPIAGVVEKPAPEAAPSRLAVAGRYVATEALLDALRATPVGAGGELLHRRQRSAQRARRCRHRALRARPLPGAVGHRRAARGGAGGLERHRHGDGASAVRSARARARAR